jgi:O-antigen/teichoic acid export membrane protein
VTSLKASVAKAAFWSSFRVGWAQIFGLIVFSLLVRMLGPKEFGLFALSITMIELLRPICSAGLAEAIQREDQPNDEVRDTAFWISLGSSLFVGLIIILLAQAYAHIIRDESVVLPMIALTSTLVISALGRVHTAFQLKNFEHKSVTFQSLCASSIAGAVAVILAFNGAGVWALVAQSIINEVLMVIFAWSINRWLPKFRFDKVLAKRILNFSSGMVFTQIIWSGLARVPDLVIGRAVGVEAVGVYRIAWRLVDLLGQTILTPLSSVTYIALAKSQFDAEKFEAVYLRVIGLAVIATVPVIVGFGLIAPELLPLLFGPKSVDSILIAQILSLSAPAFVMNYFISSALGAKGFSNIMTRIALVQLVSTLLISIVAAPYGLAAITAAYVIRGYLTLPFQQFMLQKYAGVSYRKILRCTFPSIIAAIIMVMVMLFFRTTNIVSNLNVGIIIGSYIFIGATIYIGTLFVTSRSTMNAQYDFIRSLILDLKGQQR